MAVAKMAECYEERASEPWGRAQKAEIRRIRASRLADKRVDQLIRQDFIAHIDARRHAADDEWKRINAD